MPTNRVIGIAARILARQAGGMVQRGGGTGILDAALSAGRTTAVSLGRVVHQLWLEVTGFIFLAIAAIGGLAVAREYAKYRAGQAATGRVLLAVCFTLVFAWFGLSSFWRVRKRNQRR